MAPYLSNSQMEALAVALGKEKALTKTLDGYRFEAILAPILPDCVPALHLDPKRVPDTRDKKWFDLRQGSRGIEAKTFKAKVDNITPGTVVKNVLKRVPPDALPKELSRGEGKRRQVNRKADPAKVGGALLAYIDETRKTHAQEKGITGRHDFAVLFRNRNFTQVGYWEEPFDLGDAKDYEWSWIDSGLDARLKGESMLTWYSANQMQLFYRFKAPADVQLFTIPDLEVVLLTKQEHKSLLKGASRRRG